MIALSAQNALLAVWICFTVMVLIGIIAVFVWAVRARQFSDQDRARHLPLRSNIPPEGDEAGGADSPGKEQGSGKRASV